MKTFSIEKNLLINEPVNLVFEALTNSDCYSLMEVENGTNLKFEHQNIKSQAMYYQILDVWDFLLSNLNNFVETN